MKKALTLLILFVASLPAWGAGPARPAAEQAKIDWLLSEIEHSDAVFIRNGVEYGGEKAASHLKSKLFWAGKRVQTARDFITGIATKSETSGKPYEIRTKDGGQQPLGAWLKSRLEAFEKKPAAAR